MSDSNSDQTTPTRARMSRVVPTVVGVLALVAAAFTVGRWSKAPVADVRESTMLAATLPGFVTANTPANIVSGTPTAITLTFTAGAGDEVAWAPTGKCAGATYKLATVGLNKATTFTLVDGGAYKLCIKRTGDGATGVEQTLPALTVSTAKGFVTASAPANANIVSGTPKAITLTFTAIAGDMVAWAPTGKCAGATYQAATVGVNQANTFTVVGDGALKLCFRRPANDGTTPVEQTVPALTASMDVNNWGTCYSQATVGKAYAQIQVLDNIIRGTAVDPGTDNAVAALTKFYGTPLKCDATCKANADQAMSQMLSGVAAGAAR